RVGIVDAFEVARAWLGTGVFERGKRARIVAQSGDAGTLVVDVAEDDRAGRTCLFARRLDLAVRDRSTFDPRVDPGAAGSLHAVGALLHHAARPDGDVGIVREVLDRLFVLVKVEPVEAAHLVRAVVRAKARADAALVGHLIEPVARVGRRVDRAHVFARRFLAVLAEHRLELDALVHAIRVDAKPVHRPAFEDAVATDGRNVVLGLARDDARAAPGAAREIDRHAPLHRRFGSRRVGIERERRPLLLRLLE